MFQPLRLKDTKPLVSKNKKYIFAHPTDDRLLIKVANRKGTLRRWGIRRFYKRWYRGGLYADYMRSLKEYIFLRANSRGDVQSIPRIFGLIDTDLGLGLVVEKIRGPDGELARPLISILRESGLTTDIREKLGSFIDELVRNDVVVNDLSMGNIVYADNGTDGGRFVLVDGFGERTVVPLYSMSKSLNKRNTLQKYRRMLKSAQAISSSQAQDGKAANRKPEYRH